MGVEYPPNVLHIEPHAIPAIRTEIQTTLHTLRPLLSAMRTDAYIHKPWLADPESVATQEYYNRVIMEAPDGPFQAALTWRDDLQATHDTLQEMEDRYRRTEGDNAELWGRSLA